MLAHHIRMKQFRLSIGRKAPMFAGNVRLSVTATTHNEIFDAKMRSRSDVAPKHDKGERSVRNRTAKNRKCRPRRTSTRDDCIDVYSICRTRYCAHPWEIDVALVAETSAPDACLRIPAVSCVVTSRGQFHQMTQTLDFIMFFLAVN